MQTPWEYMAINLRLGLSPAGVILIILAPWLITSSPSIEWEEPKPEVHEEA